jgi:hypothetical protein
MYGELAAGSCMSADGSKSNRRQSEARGAFGNDHHAADDHDQQADRKQMKRGDAESLEWSEDKDQHYQHSGQRRKQPVGSFVTQAAQFADGVQNHHLAPAKLSTPGFGEYKCRQIQLAWLI